MTDDVDLEQTLVKSPSDGDDISVKEERQKKHYYYLSELQSMSRELPAYVKLSLSI